MPVPEPVLAGVLACAMALLLDRLLGEPKPHPLAGFGALAVTLEKTLNRGAVAHGVVAVLVLVVPVCLLVAAGRAAIEPTWPGAAFDALVLYLVIGWRSMQQHALAVLAPLRQGDLAAPGEAWA